MGSVWIHHRLKQIAWHTEERDTFPVRYLMNTRADLAEAFAAGGFTEVFFAFLDDCRTTSRSLGLNRLELLARSAFAKAGWSYPERCLLAAYLAGGYVAGRMSRFDGARQGLAVWLIGLLVVLLLAAAGGILGSQYNVLQQLNLPRIPIDEGTATTAGIITLVAILLVTLLGAVLGGKLGERYHRKVDRAGFPSDPLLDRPRTARLSGASSVRRVPARAAPTLPACAGTSDRCPTSSRRRRTTRSPRRCSTSARSRGDQAVAGQRRGVRPGGRRGGRRVDPAARRPRHDRTAQGPRDGGGQGPGTGGAALRHLRPARLIAHNGYAAARRVGAAPHP